MVDAPVVTLGLLDVCSGFVMGFGRGLGVLIGICEL
jgi:hypothetical protein